MMGTLALDDLKSDAPSWRAIEVAFATLGRAVLLLDQDFKVLVATQSLGEMLCDQAAEQIVGHPISDLLGDGFAPVGSEVRNALERGMTQEGRRAFLHCQEGQSRLASVSGRSPSRYRLSSSSVTSLLFSSLTVSPPSSTPLEPARGANAPCLPGCPEPSKSPHN